jgi:hypothetical protein
MKVTRALAPPTQVADVHPSEEIGLERIEFDGFVKPFRFLVPDPIQLETLVDACDWVRGENSMRLGKR